MGRHGTARVAGPSVRRPWQRDEGGTSIGVPPLPLEEMTVDAAELRALQTPLKQRYRDDPGTACAPMEARASWADPGITATVSTWAGPVRAGLHPFTGGDGSDACSGDMLLQALLGCAGVTMRSVATAMGVEVRGAELTARGQMDARGTLGVSREAPVGMRDIEVVAELDTDADDTALERLAQLTERYCVVAQTLAVTPHLTVRRTVPVSG
jgi:uncharacterized OsmC-like protein